MPVPACPGWAVPDLVRHLTEIAHLVLGKLTGRRPPDLGGADLLRDWDEVATMLEEVLAERGGGTGTQLVADAVVHELDLRCALAEPLPARHPAYACAFRFGMAGMDRSIREKGLPAVTFTTGEESWLLGGDDPVASVRAEPVDLIRSLSGRRTHAQIARLSWSADPAPWLPAFTWGPFTPPGSPVEEMFR
ncbi:TIGR03083 family protein [Saccharopolyspora antimicrobica]|uniref:TIGR03083 family protein n=1 Tax=Saccharopolyspora antimicrobica TaxID=455193 RepID=A0A1I5LYV7_9PSEU|nr:TIGR03083 family protein [Saccharopolyspora antimicrobica]